MQSVKEILENGPAVSPYTGSTTTYDMVAEQIKKRWGDKEVKNYDPYSNARTFAQWVRLGYRVKKGERSLKSITFISKKDAKGNIIKRYPRKINLFYYRSMEPVNN
ncbi:hypothetical protein EXS45_02365 [Candidatus Nomurabacteria bacterium]|nr:hypothetical protein [Candidatus Nomurabacteria bacterium]